MRKLKYILLGLLLVSSNAYSEDTDLPDLTKPDAAKTAPEQKKQVLDKAIDDVFKEPKSDTAAAPAIPALPVAAPSEAPAVDEAAAPEVAPIDPTAAEPVSVTPTAPAPEAAAPAPLDPLMDPTAAAPSAPAAVPATPVAAPVAAPSEKSVTIESPVEEKADKANVAPDKFNAPEVKAEKPKAKPKPKPKKKVIAPIAAPKSLRQDYPVSGADAPVPSDIAAPIAAAPAVMPASAPVKAAPMKAAPKMAPANYPPGTYPINKKGHLPLEDKVIDEAEHKPKEFRAVKIAKVETNDLDVLGHLPLREKVVNIQKDITIDDGIFPDPFATDDGKIEKSGSQALADMNNDPNTPQTPVVDLTESAAPADATATADGTAPANGDAFSETAENTAVAPAKKAPKNFYMRDKSLEMSVKDAPKTPLVKMDDAYAALKVGQYESAIKYYSDALKVDPDNQKALFGIATAYHMSKDYDKAKETYLKIINNDPKYWPAINNYIILVTEENPENSIAKLQDLYKHNPEFAAIPAQIGNLYYKKGDVQNAVKNYMTAIKLDPKNVEYKYNLAVILDKSNYYADASVLYKSLLDDAAAGTELPASPITIRDRYFELVSKQNQNG